MGKFNTASAAVRQKSPIRGSAVADGRNFHNAPAYSRDPRSELFLLAVSNMVSTEAFYEAADHRDNRYRHLIQAVAVVDPEWIARFLPWLRNKANMRSASLVGAVEAADAMRIAGLPGGRKLIDSVIVRADEPAEALAYWTTKYGRKIPQPIKRGIADAVRRLYTQFNFLKWDSRNNTFRFADVIALVHPKPASAEQSSLFRYIAKHRSNPDTPVPLGILGQVWTNRAVRKAILAEGIDNVTVQTLSTKLADAGLTWEDSISMAGQIGASQKKMWEATIPSMGIMALIRNLANFDKAGLPDAAIRQVQDRLASADQIKRSRQLPFRFYSAHKNVGSLRWGEYLEKALAVSVSSVPAFDGRTLVLVDQSSSMFPYGYGGNHKQLGLNEKASLFGSVIALRAEAADLYQYGTAHQRIPFTRGDSVLRTMGKFSNMGGTDTQLAVVMTYDKHDRVVIITDEQTNPGWTQALSVASRYWAETRRRFDHMGRVVMDVPKKIDDVVPANIPIYTWNLGGYKFGHLPDTPNRYVFGGLSDAAFGMIPALESGKDAVWPF